MFRDDLLSVLDLGWETSRQAWRLLSPVAAGQGTSFSPAAVGSTGRDLDQLAYDLRRMGYDKPARLAYSVAFILNGLANQSILCDREVADKTSQIVAVLAEMLLELEATSQVTTREPVEIVEHLKTHWGLVVFGENHPTTESPRPHVSQPADEPKPPTEEALPDLAAISDELVWVSESLMKRVLQAGGSPYAVPLSRIHHLGATIRDRINAQSKSQRTARQESVPLTEAPQSIPARQPATSTIVSSVFNAVSESVVVEELSPSTDRGARPITGDPFADRTPRVLVIDESPFFRMLLTSAIEAAGYLVRAVSCLAVAQEMCASERWDLVLCAGNELTGNADGSWDWLRDQAAAWNATVIGLSSGAAELAPESVSVVPRTDVKGLLTLVKTTLGPASQALRISA